ncbi:demethylmenaquinone methyltransferase [Gordonia malaquae]|uniref:demethylmenaquinone methyltransferase n=1 Tax=Gordonia malaquae TaxID=410332 RepID=UPI0030FEB9B5
MTTGPHRAGLDKQPADVAEMFDGVARRYDITNTVLSFGQDRLWRRNTRRALALRPRDVVLDLAAGTAVSTTELAASGATVVAADFSLGMLRAGVRRAVPKVAADALHLPFADASFDAATISFGLRNVNDVPLALSELKRVLKPGGRLVICEFSTPTWRPFRTVYMEYLMKALPAVATKVSSNPDAYVYLAESIREWPNQDGLASLISSAGFTDVGWIDQTGGIAAIHHAIRPS